MLRGFDADVIVVQESWWPGDGRAVVDVVAADLGAEVFALPSDAALHPCPHVPRTGTGQGRVGLAVISKLPARLVTPMPLGHVFADQTPDRAGLHLELDVAGQPVDLIGVHLSSRLPYGPPIQLRRLAEQLPGPGRPAVVAGDCNFWGPGVRAFLPGWRRAVRGRTWPAIMPHSQIDHILVRPEVGVVDGVVLGDVGSDHRPVRARLRIR